MRGFFFDNFLWVQPKKKINAKKGFLRERGLNFQALPSLEVSLVDPARGEKISLLFGPHLNYFPWLSFAPWFYLFLLLSPLLFDVFFSISDALFFFLSYHFQFSFCNFLFPMLAIFNFNRGVFFLAPPQLKRLLQVSFVSRSTQADASKILFQQNRRIFHIFVFLEILTSILTDY